jgi:hypothetical protein
MPGSEDALRVPQGLVGVVQPAHQHPDEAAVEAVAVRSLSCSSASGVKEMVVQGSLTTTSAECLRSSALGAR